MEKNNYQIILLDTLKTLQNLGKKPKLLLHACCGPCFTYPFEIIKDYFEITVMYNNSNIYPEEEYIRRRDEFKRYLKDIDANLTFIETKYDNATYNKDLEELANEPEGGARCKLCFRKRFKEGFEFASKNDFEYYGTVMTISRYKNSQNINTIGLELEKEYPNVKWLSADFKKNDGYLKSLKIVREHEMYFQTYCGCKYSYLARISKEQK
jgi:predicted adenine nucleotide alpha hydrolase (AANH) superfamily ATPase